MSVEKAADVAAAVSIPAWAAVAIADWLPVVQFVLGVLAIVSTALAIAVHVRKLRGKP